MAVLDAVVLAGGLLAIGVYHRVQPDPPRAAPGPSQPATSGAGAGAGTTPAAPAAPKVDDRAPAVGLYALRPADPTSTNLTRYRIVTLNAWEWPRIAAIKQEHPDTIVLVYKDMASTRKYAVNASGNDDALLPTGVGYAAASKTHPEWFLRDDRGNRVEWSGYGSHWWMDVGSRSYTDAWLASVRAELAANGWDGVLIDNGIVDPRVYLPDRRQLAAYPTAEAYQAATEAFLNVVSPALRADGKKVVVNLGGAQPPMDLYRRWATITGGIMREHFAKGGVDGKGPLVGGDAWQVQADQQAAAAAAGALYVAVTYAPPTDESTLRYARASFLLGWEGNDRAALAITSPDPKADPWAAAWTVDVGKPIEDRRAVGTAWARAFANGIVVVNPTGAVVSVDLGGPYVGDAGRTVTTLAMAPHTGAVMRRGAA